MKFSEKADFSRFGKSFQEGLCQLVLQDRPFADQILEVLDFNFFELKYLQAFTRKIFSYREKYGVHPSSKIMMTILRSELDNESEVVQKQIRDYFARIYDQDIQDSDYIKDTALEFCKKQKLKEAMLKSVELLQSSSFEEIARTINDALRLGSDNNFGYDYLKDFEQRFLFKSRNPIATGWKEMDKIVKDGLGKGELGVVIAPTGAGKSMALVHIGAQAVKAGKTVVYYTLELQDTVVGSRFDSCITGFPLGDLKPLKEEIFDMVKGLPGNLIIKEYPTRSASTNTIKTHLEKLKNRGIDVDMVIVDYADLLRPVNIKKERRHELENLYEDLRGIAQELKFCVWTASQTNRSGLNSEIITMESISEAFNKCFVADFIFSISRTVQDKAVNGGRIFVAKNRNGPDGIVFPIFMDTSNVSIKVLPQMSEETLNETNALSSKEQSKVLYDKYRKFKKGSTANV